MRESTQSRRARRLGKAERIVIVRRLRQRGEHRRFGEAEFIEWLVEIGLGRRGDAIGLLAEIDLVEVKLQNPLFGEALVDAKGQNRLADLAPEGRLVAEQHVFCELLRNGGGADRPPSLVEMPKIGDGGAQDGERIDAAMGPEILILGGDEGLFDDIGNGGIGRIDAPLLGKLGHQRAIGREHPAHYRRLIILEPGDIGKIGSIVAIGAIGDDRRSQPGEHDEPGERTCKPAEPAREKAPRTARAGVRRRVA